MKVTGLLFSFRRVVCGERHAFFTIYIIAWNRECETGMLFLRTKERSSFWQKLSLLDAINRKREDGAVKVG